MRDRHHAFDRAGYPAKGNRWNAPVPKPKLPGRVGRANGGSSIPWLGCDEIEGLEFLSPDRCANAAHVTMGIPTQYMSA
jgi:hypothetical protein